MNARLSLQRRLVSFVERSVTILPVSAFVSRRSLAQMRSLGDATIMLSDTRLHLSRLLVRTSMDRRYGFGRGSSTWGTNSQIGAVVRAEWSSTIRSGPSTCLRSLSMAVALKLVQSKED